MNFDPILFFTFANYVEINFKRSICSLLVVSARHISLDPFASYHISRANVKEKFNDLSLLHVRQTLESSQLTSMACRISGLSDARRLKPAETNNLLLDFFQTNFHLKEKQMIDVNGLNQSADGSATCTSDTVGIRARCHNNKKGREKGGFDIHPSFDQVVIIKVRVPKGIVRLQQQSSLPPTMGLAPDDNPPPPPPSKMIFLQPLAGTFICQSSDEH
ncbi:hypothetical protein OUZ56_022553 [Daphnia magna]|uniref:Uncharacterized protein n=1 Tax=Daphnia magna TaxID=35525 RepID=A0ABR0AWR4_9CRUS|nr:hypothetical protein OUZ56_022553 [Daphnia magna]